MNPEHKLVAVLVSVISLFVGAVGLMGPIMLMVLGVYQGGWPAIALFETTFFVIGSWLFLRGRFENGYLIAFNIVVLIAMFFMLIGTAKNFSVDINYMWATMIYIGAGSLTVLQYVVSLCVAFGVMPVKNQVALSQPVRKILRNCSLRSGEFHKNAFY